MNPLRQYCLLIVSFSSILSLSCKETGPENPSQFQVQNNYNLTVTGIQYDEFQRIVPFQGTASLTVIDAGRSLHGTISTSDPSFTFKNISTPRLIVYGEKDGFYPYENSYFTSVAKFYPFPSPQMRIDTIQIGPIRFGNELEIRMVANQSIPENVPLDCACFFGLDSTVSSKRGTYFGTSVTTTYGNREFYTSFYKSNLFPAGTKIFFTARFYTGATKTFVDSTANIMVFMNLEENTKVIASFIY